MRLFGRKAEPAYDHEKVRLASNLDEAEIRHLDILRREIANMIIAVDPDLMIRCFDRAYKFEREMADNPLRARAEEAALVAKMPMFSDFDLIGTKHFIPYASAREMLSDDDLVERYLEISHMLVIMNRRDELKSKYPVHNESDRNILGDRMQAENNRRFRKRIEDAIARFDAYRSGLRKSDPAAHGIANFEDAEVEVIHLPSFADIQYGITFKKSEEYGIYSFYVHDDGRISYMYFRSDASFKEQHVI